MPWKAYQWKKSQPLTEDYIHHFDRVSALFDYNPWDKGSLHRRAEAVRHTEGNRADRKRLAEVLLEYNRRIGNQETALSAAAGLAEENSLTVVGGQQAGLFGGPLLVIYKAITVLIAARQAQAELGTPVVPVFWIAGEDHDFDEVDHIQVQRPELDVHKLSIRRPWNLRTSVSRWQADEQAWEDAFRRLDESLPDSPHKTELLSRMRSSMNGLTTLSDTFAGWMAALFGDSGLVLLDADDPALRKLESPMFTRLIGANELLADALMRGRRELETLGYTPQVDVTDEQSHLFVIEPDGERVLLQRSGEGFADKKDLRAYSREELLALAEREPERLSNGVLSRPLMQEFLLPVLGTVLGPAEVAYWAMTRDAFALHGMTMPILLPRLEFTLVEDAVTKWMDRYDLSMDDVTEGIDERREAWLRAQSPFPVGERFEEARVRVKEAYTPLVDSLAAIEAGLPELGHTNLDKILHQIDYLERKAEQALVRRHDAALSQWKRIELALMPLGKPQERVYNLCAYLNRYGDKWLSELLDADLPMDGGHYLVYI
ncbi:bacillithiol biosynthesis cysteine-adding enzyme BshC [Paenibacillus chitinolyticus]|uniref:Putative cysteine ligase BshC n=1 Tax=Paenibacillus chitinolyticus TaxID=79263 RepID=A0A410X174_9BACL|nr:bacillithiol biosynthesis cysteine-adding enzyme BshC [Paenibacillus chitinolyticus]MCY9588612.1 bacillithiol biosynthesis cysteine-adding enzyme BshC [Paenibacillus chitinolyticus]MCY9597982.1 bacillithiol biosynthesis cysteine-adding enzyme BshC [Paenibacillus chitinolyticus]QAV20357.1 bacillithiol biosynthesis cysteine-adding enzyme BshC [Paenibacillus chitinolyticus]